MAETLTAPADIGFIGLGNMGTPMAGKLIEAGYKVFAFDADPGAVSRFAETHSCEQPRSVEELAQHCRVVITMLPNGDIVRDVLTGENRLAEFLEDGAIVIDMSSSSPVGTRQLNEVLKARNLALVDAPVSGGVVKAEQGGLAIMAGGDMETVEYCRPMFECMGKLFHAGTVGAGHAMKSLNNFLSAATLAVTGEAVITGTRFGLDPERMVEIINASTGRSNSSEHKFPAFVLNRRFDSGFAMSLMAKDLRLALELAESNDTPHELIEKISELWNRAGEQLGPDADNTEIVKYLEALTGDHGDG